MPLKSALLKYILPLLLMVSVAMSHCVYAENQVVIHNARIRAVIPGNNITSAYLTIVNNTDKELTLLGASADISDRIEIHEHQMSNGMMQMRQLPHIHIAAGKRAEFKPFGLHFMVFKLKRPLKNVELIPLILHFSEHPDIKVELQVTDLMSAKPQ